MKFLARPILLPLTLGVLLSACGGGGDSSSTSASTSGNTSTAAATSLDLSSQANANKVALEASSSSTGLNQYSDVGLGLLSGAEHSSAQRLDVVSVSRIAMNLATQKQLGVLDAAEATESCDAGGSVTAITTGASDTVMVAGDQIEMVANNCRVTDAGVTTTMNGRFVIVVRQGSLSSSSSSLVGLRLDILYSNFSIALSSTDGSGSASVDGGVSLSFPDSTTTVIGSTSALPSLTQIINAGSINQQSTTSNWSVTLRTPNSYSSTISGYGTVASNSFNTGGMVGYSWSTTSNLNLNNAVLTSGEMRITSGADTSKVVVVKYGQSCQGSNTCVSIQRVINGLAAAPELLTWTAFNAL